MVIDPVTPTIGAEISGIDLAELGNSADLDEIYSALIEYLVLFFRDQKLSPGTQLQFAKTFGDLAKPHPVYPNVPGFDQVVLLENDGERPPDTDDWHTDLTFQASPPFLSVLCAKQVPETGGDTLWANMYAAFDTLPSEIQTMVSRLSAVHDMGAFRNSFVDETGNASALNKAMSEIGSAIHPIAPRHPVTGRRLLFVNRSFTQHIVGMLKAESDRLLEYLFGHIETASLQVRFRWRNKSVAIWDNRSTQHYAVADYLPAYRCMHRVIVNTDRRA